MRPLAVGDAYATITLMHQSVVSQRKNTFNCGFFLLPHLHIGVSPTGNVVDPHKLHLIGYTRSKAATSQAVDALNEVAT
jgi:hypothetical protein